MDNNKINWINVITNKEFQSYLNIKLAVSISMISKLVRNKLKPLIFNRIKISSLELSLPNNNIFIRYINDRYNLNPEDNISNEANNFFKSPAIETGIDDFKSALIDIFIYARQFHLSCMDRAGYYLYSITKFFNNLSTLKLSYCYIPLAEFSDFGTMFPNLALVDLCAVHFAKLYSDTISSEEIVYPPNIRKLTISGCDVITTCLRSNEDDFLYRRNISHNIAEFILPNISMPSLKELTFFDDGELSTELAGLLKLNPNLETFTSRFFYLNDISTPNLLKKLNLEGMGYDENIYQFPNLESLKNLSIKIIGDYLYDVKQLCLFSPNLERLQLVLCDNPYYQIMFDNYLDPIISNLPSLKFLKLDINTNESDIINFSKFTQIETLSLRIHSNIISNFDFTNYNHLKKIELVSNYGRVRVNEVKEKLNGYESWIFNIKVYSIIGFKRVK
jgi:hypothetical protein